MVGTKLPAMRGGPWNMVAGDPRVLAYPDTMIFEDGVRDTLGGLNLGSVREVNGHDVQVGGFTWGLLPFGPSYAFADYDLARLLLHVDSDQAHFILVGVQAGRDARRTCAIASRRAFPEVKVVTRAGVRQVDGLLRPRPHGDRRDVRHLRRVRPDHRLRHRLADHLLGGHRQHPRVRDAEGHRRDQLGPRQAAPRPVDRLRPAREPHRARPS